MQTLFARYIFRQATGALVLILLALTAVLWIALALKSLNVVTSQGQTTWTFIRITLLALPNLLTVIAPVALMIATIQTLNRANGDSELIVVTASGAPVWHIARPFLILAGFVAALIAVGATSLNPWSARALQSQIAQVRTDLITQVLKPGQFSSPETGLTFHIRDRDRNGVISGLLMRDNREKGQSLTYLAEQARITKENGKPYLVMISGHIIRKKLDRPVPQVIAFQTYAVDIEQMAPKSSTIWLKPKSRYIGELLNPDPKDKYFVRWPGKFRAELHERFVSILYPFVFVLIVLSQLGHAQTTRQGRIQQVINAVVLAGAVRLGGLALTKLVAKSAWAVPLLYLLPIAAIVLAACAVHIKMSPRKQSALGRKIEDAQHALLAFVGRLIFPGRVGTVPGLATERPS
ncbi:MAG: LPS export ABC transporter permease LptF [Hyphomicrobiaceae bacterium]